MTKESGILFKYNLEKRAKETGRKVKKKESHES